MRRVVIDMQSFLFADAIANTLKNTGSDFEIYSAESPDDTAELCRLCVPYALIMEVTPYSPYVLEDRMSIRNEVKAINSHCKVVLITNENSEKKIADRVLLTRKDGLIDQFIYSSISASYLAAVIDTL